MPRRRTPEREMSPGGSKDDSLEKSKEKNAEYFLHLGYDVIKNFGKSDEAREKARKISDAHGELVVRFSEQDRRARAVNENAPVFFDEKTSAMLFWKLATYVQKNNPETIDALLLFDAIQESPGFLKKETGTLRRALEVHQEKIIQKIAEEKRKRKEEEKMELPERVYTTTSGEYALFRLRTKTQLLEESDRLKHCVGTEKKYLENIQKNDEEILSVRAEKDISIGDAIIPGGSSVVTIQYEKKTGAILQMRGIKNTKVFFGWDNEKNNSIFGKDVLEIIGWIVKSSAHPQGYDKFALIAPNEMSEIRAMNILTDKGDVSYAEFFENPDDFVLITLPEDFNADKVPLKYLSQYFKYFFNMDISQTEIMTRFGDLSEGVPKVYIGPFSEEENQYQGIRAGSIASLPESVEYVFLPNKLENRRYEYVPVERVAMQEKTCSKLLDELEEHGVIFKMRDRENVLAYARGMGEKKRTKQQRFICVPLHLTNIKKVRTNYSIAVLPDTVNTTKYGGSEELKRCTAEEMLTYVLHVLKNHKRGVENEYIYFPDASRREDGFFEFILRSEVGEFSKDLFGVRVQENSLFQFINLVSALNPMDPCSPHFVVFPLQTIDSMLSTQGVNWEEILSRIRKFFGF